MPTYSKKVFWSLIAFHLIFTTLFSVAAVIASGWFRYYIHYFAILGIIPIITVLLQNRKHRNFGYIIFANLFIEIKVWLLSVSGFADSYIMKGHEFNDKLFFIEVLALILIPIFVHIYIASSLFRFTAKRKALVAFVATALFAGLMGGSIAFKTIDSVKPTKWPTLEYAECGYTIQYSPTLYFIGGNFGSQKCGYQIFEQYVTGNKLQIDVFKNSYGSIDEWLRNGWQNVPWTGFDPYFGIGTGKYEEAHSLYFNDKKGWYSYFEQEVASLLSVARKTTVNNYEAIRLPEVSQSFAIFVSDGGKRILKATCSYGGDDEILEMCNMMIETITFDR